MNKIIFPALLLIALMSLSSCDFISDNDDTGADIDGAWQMTESYYYSDNITITYDENAFYPVQYYDGKKMITYSVKVSGENKSVTFCSDDTKSYSADDKNLTFSYESNKVDVSIDAKYSIKNDVLNISYKDGSKDTLKKVSKTILKTAEASCTAY